MRIVNEGSTKGQENNDSLSMVAIMLPSLERSGTYRMDDREQRMRRNFSVNLRLILVIRKTNPSDLADATGIGISTLLRYIDGHQMPNTIHCLDLAGTLGLSIDLLLSDPSILLTKTLPSFDSSIPGLNDVIRDHAEQIRIARANGRRMKMDQHVMFFAEYISKMEEFA